MKLWILLPLLSIAAIAQPSEGTDFIDMGGDVIPTYIFAKNNGQAVLDYTTQYSWSITRAANGDKAFTFSAKQCNYISQLQIFPGKYLWVDLPTPQCTELSESEAKTLGPIAAALTEFYDFHPSAPHEPPVYNPSPTPTLVAGATGPVRPRLNSVPPVSPPDAQMIFLDGLSSNAIKFDLTTDTILGQVAIPTTSGPMAIRPVATGTQNEIWAANGGLEVTVADVAAQQVVANILTPTVPAALLPTSLVFSADGATAYEAVSFFSSDSAGNNGALLVFDAVKRTLASTFLLKNAPTSMVIAPDGSTVYLLSPNGLLTYYDVLSGTADLSVTTYTPGQPGGYSGSSDQVFIHPDGTRLFWNVNNQIVIFDLTARKMLSLVNTGLPSTATALLQMAQDGSTLWVTNASGPVAVYDVRSGNILGKLTLPANAVFYPGPAQ